MRWFYNKEMKIYKVTVLVPKNPFRCLEAESAFLNND